MPLTRNVKTKKLEIYFLDMSVSGWGYEIFYFELNPNQYRT